MAKILSTEDGVLQGASLNTSRDRLYSDIDLSFAVNTSTGDIFKKKDAAAVKQAVRNLLQCNRFEKPFRPDFGADLRGLLFELADDGVEQDLIEQVQGAIARYEPRVEINDLELIPSKPCTQHQQLMMILPPQSSFLLPRHCKEMVHGKLRHLYPIRFKTDRVDKKVSWTWTPILPFIHFEEIKDNVHS